MSPEAFKYLSQSCASVGIVLVRLSSSANLNSDRLNQWQSFNPKECDSSQLSWDNLSRYVKVPQNS
jgi:hypothetical protein